MQNLPITAAIQPATPAQTPNPADSNATQTAETFGNVLARQRASTGESSSGAKGNSQPTSPSPSTSSTDSANSAVTGNDMEAPTPEVISILPGDMLAALQSVSANEKPDTQAPVPDGVVGTLPNDMLAALLSASTNANGVATDEKPASQAPSPDGVSTLPGDMLAALLHIPMAGRQQPTATDARGSGARQQPVAAGAQNGVLQFASAGQPLGEPSATSLLHAQNKATSTIAAADVTQGKNFSTVLNTLGKDAATTALPGATQTSAQAAVPDASTLASLTQGTTSPVAASQIAPAQVAVNTPVTNDAWGDEFNQKITWLATQHEQTAELHLNPPHLGPLDVVLNISGDQATALFTSPHAAVREAVEQALPKLREMLSDNGIMLGNATVNDQSPREQQAGQPDKQPGRNANLPAETNVAVSAGGTVWPVRRHLGMVDTFV